MSLLDADVHRRPTICVVCGLRLEPRCESHTVQTAHWRDRVAATGDDSITDAVTDAITIIRGYN